MPSHVALYGLATCDTTRAARKWLSARGIAHAFQDVREDGLTRAIVETWVKQLGWEKVLNKASATWRGLPTEVKEGIDRPGVIPLLLAHPTLVKRPVLDVGGSFTLGFKPDAYALLFG